MPQLVAEQPDAAGDRCPAVPQASLNIFNGAFNGLGQTSAEREPGRDGG